MEGLRNKKYGKYYLATLFVIALILLPTHQAQANWLTDWAFEAVFGNILFVIFSVVGKIIGVLAIGLNWVIHIRVYPDGGLLVVDESWKIMRDFANLFFIVALIVMAFATIFNITKYEARTLFPKFLISALLINFSLVLGVLVIDASQVLTNTFLVPIGDMSMRLGQDLNLSLLLPNKAGISAAIAVDSVVFGTLVSLVFSVVLLFTFLFSLLTAFLFAIIRIPILWALLVVSPIAWVLNIFPAGQDTYKKWWKLFIGWNMFLPIFLFFLYFGLYFLSSQDEVMQKIAADLSSAKPTSDLPFSFQLLFFYVLTAIFLIGGTITAMKAAMFSGTGVVSVAKWSRGVAARRLGLTAAGAAAKQRWEQVQKEGLPTRFGQAIFGGQRALDLATAQRARQFGVRGALEKGVDIEKDRQKPFANNVVELRRLAAGGSREQMLAARGRLAELGDKEFLIFDRIQETHRMAGGERSELANKIMGNIDYGKLDKDTRQKLSNWTAVRNNAELFKKNALAMVEKDKLDESEVEGLAKQFLNDADIKEFFDKGTKKNLLAVAQARVKMGIEGAKKLDEELEKAFKKMTDDQILEMMNDPGFGELIKDPLIRGAMNNTVGKNPKRLAILATKTSGDTQRRLEVMAKVARRAQNKPKIESLRKKEQGLEYQINQARQDLTNIESRLDQIKNYPTSADFKRLQGELESKENEIKSLADKRDKLNERIDNIRRGEPGGTPTP